MLKVNTFPKAHESRFPTIRLPNGNVVKFSHTNRKHLTVCELMAFHSVKMGIKTPKPLPLVRRGPHPWPDRVLGTLCLMRFVGAHHLTLSNAH